MSTAHENALVAEPRGCSHRSDEGTANTPTNQMMTEETAMPIVENSRVFRNLLDSIVPAMSADVPEAVISDLERLIPWHQLSATTVQRLLPQMLEQLLEEFRDDGSTACLPVPADLLTDLSTPDTADIIDLDK